MKLLWREALLAFQRTRTLSVLSITTIAFALFVTGLFGLVALNRTLKDEDPCGHNPTQARLTGAGCCEC